MLKAIVLVFVGLAFLILILGAALGNDYEGYDDDYGPDSCDGECDAEGEFGECSKCGWIDHLAQSKKAAD